jgi:hypothetical protein
MNQVAARWMLVRAITRFWRLPAAWALQSGSAHRAPRIPADGSHVLLEGIGDGLGLEPGNTGPLLQALGPLLGSR